MMQNYVIYGAQSLALGMYKAISYLYPEYPCDGFVVTSLEKNPSVLAGLPVMELDYLAKKVPLELRKNLTLIIAVPENLHREIVRLLHLNQFQNYICMDSRKEATLMERYFTKRECFPSLHQLKAGEDKSRLQVYQVRCHKDSILNGKSKPLQWQVSIQAGASLTQERMAEFSDNVGDHISEKNVNYCELTVLYWIWKNRLMQSSTKEDNEYYGLFHYRRWLDITEEDLYRLQVNAVDVILPYPTFHEPDISEHHKKYVKVADWKALMQAIYELHPEYAAIFTEIERQPYFYNYNMLIARENIMRDYCSWLFPILERTEELSSPKGRERSDRYIGYLGESLMTLYFLYHSSGLHIVHTGRLMLT